MTAYNKVNGTHMSENKDIIEGILRKEWGWDGLVMSDWYACDMRWGDILLLTAQVRDVYDV